MDGLRGGRENTGVEEPMDMRSSLSLADSPRLLGRALARLGISRRQIRSLGVLKPTLQDGVTDDVDAAAQVELSHRVGFVHLDCFHADIELSGDLLVAMADGNQAKHLRLAVGNMWRPRSLGASVARDECVRHTSRQR